MVPFGNKKNFRAISCARVALAGKKRNTLKKPICNISIIYSYDFIQAINQPIVHYAVHENILHRHMYTKQKRKSIREQVRQSLHAEKTIMELYPAIYPLQHIMRNGDTEASSDHCGLYLLAS